MLLFLLGSCAVAPQHRHGDCCGAEALLLSALLLWRPLRSLTEPWCHLKHKQGLSQPATAGVAMYNRFGAAMMAWRTDEMQLGSIEVRIEVKQPCYWHTTLCALALCPAAIAAQAVCSPAGGCSKE